MRLAFIQTLLFSQISSSHLKDVSVRANFTRLSPDLYKCTQPNLQFRDTWELCLLLAVGLFSTSTFPFPAFRASFLGVLRCLSLQHFHFLPSLLCLEQGFKELRWRGGAHPQPLPPSQWLGAFAFSNVFNQIKRIEDMQMPFPKRNTGLNCCWQVTASHHPQQPLS